MALFIEMEMNGLVTVTVIMPVYNKAQYINESIQSVLNQTFQNFELLIVNDGSTDDSEKTIQRLMVQDQRIKYYKQENKGVAEARNVGVTMAKGEYIAFLDADDIYKETFVEKMIEAIKDKNIAICNYDFKSDDKLRKTKWKCKEGDILVDYLYNKCVPNMNCWLIKRAFILKYDLQFPTDNSWGEDQSFFIKVLCHEKDISCVNEALTIYNINMPNSLSRNSLDKLFKDIEWLNKIKQYIKEQVVDQERKKAALYAIDTYKLPALLIYRLVMNKGLIEQRLYKEAHNQVKEYINQSKFSNGLRSIKLFFAKLKL